MLFCSGCSSCLQELLNSGNQSCGISGGILVRSGNRCCCNCGCRRDNDRDRDRERDRDNDSGCCNRCC